MAQATPSTPTADVENDFLGRRTRPWTIWVVVGIGLAGNVFSLVANASVWNAIVTVFGLALLTDLWRGHPGVRLYFVLTMFVLVVLNSIGLVNDPAEHWLGLASSTAILALLLAPPTHRWAEQREHERELRRHQKLAA